MEEIDSMIPRSFSSTQHEFRCETEGKETTITAAGRLYGPTIADFNAALERSYDDGGRIFTLNFSQLTTLSSDAIRAISMLHLRANREGGEIAIICRKDPKKPNPFQEEIFRQIHSSSLDRRIVINPTIREEEMALAGT